MNALQAKQPTSDKKTVELKIGYIRGKEVLAICTKPIVAIEKGTKGFFKTIYITKDTKVFDCRIPRSDNLKDIIKILMTDNSPVKYIGNGKCGDYVNGRKYYPFNSNTIFKCITNVSHTIIHGVSKTSGTLISNNDEKYSYVKINEDIYINKITKTADYVVEKTFYTPNQEEFNVTESFGLIERLGNTVNLLTEYLIPRTEYCF